MSHSARSNAAQDSRIATESMFSKVQTELADNYIEVEVEGISFSRVLCVYAAGAQLAKDRMLTSVRSLFRLHPAH